jgi:hypothetical protein
MPAAGSAGGIEGARMEEVTYRSILGRTLAMVGEDWSMAALVTIALTAVSTLCDVEAPQLGNLLGIPVLVVEYYLLRRLLDRHGLRSSAHFAGFGTFFVLGLVTGLATIVGFLFFIVPGIYLSARWAMADAALLAEGGTSREAMDRSWALTKPHAVPIALAIVTITLPSIAVMGATLAAVMWPDVIPATFTTRMATFGSSATLNLFIYASQVVGWYFGIALYALLVGRPGDQLAEVFA